MNLIREVPLMRRGRRRDGSLLSVFAPPVLDAGKIMARELGVISIDRRFCGPAGSANGGYASGRLAAFVEGPARAMLKAPPPLGVALTVVETESGVAAMDGERVVAVAGPGAVAATPPAIPGDDALDAARAEYLANPQHMIFPYCFVCGPKRAAGEGLRIFAGAAPGSPVNAGRWRPGADLAGGDGLVAAEYLWAALDCPSAFALRRSEGLCLLGAMSASIARRPKPGERLVALAWKDRSEGRKHFASSVLVDENGETVAASNALWIDVNDPDLLRKLRTENE